MTEEEKPEIEVVEDVQVKVVYGVNPTSGWGLLATMDNEGKIVHQLLMICPGFATDQDFVVGMQRLAVEKMRMNGLVLQKQVDEEVKES